LPTGFEAKRLSLPALLLALLLGACASAPVSPLPPGEAVHVLPVKNLSGVTLRVPELWLADAGEAAAGLEVEQIDLRLLAEAGLRSRLLQRGYVAEAGATHELHGAISRFDMSGLRRTGRITIGLTVMLVDAGTANVLASAEVEQDCQLLDTPPAEAGILGEQRFIRRKLESFSEGIAAVALQELGM
jgi:hypothetical protein